MRFAGLRCAAMGDWPPPAPSRPEPKSPQPAIPGAGISVDSSKLQNVCRWTGGMHNGRANNLHNAITTNHLKPTPPLHRMSLRRNHSTPQHHSHTPQPQTSTRPPLPARSHDSTPPCRHTQRADAQAQRAKLTGRASKPAPTTPPPTRADTRAPQKDTSPTPSSKSTRLARAPRTTVSKPLRLRPQPSPCVPSPSPPVWPLFALLRPRRAARRHAPGSLESRTSLRTQTIACRRDAVDAALSRAARPKSVRMGRQRRGLPVGTRSARRRPISTVWPPSSSCRVVSWPSRPVTSACKASPRAADALAFRLAVGYAMLQTPRPTPCRRRCVCAEIGWQWCNRDTAIPSALWRPPPRCPVPALAPSSSRALEDSRIRALEDSRPRVLDDPSTRRPAGPFRPRPNSRDLPFLPSAAPGLPRLRKLPSRALQLDRTTSVVSRHFWNERRSTIETPLACGRRNERTNEGMNERMNERMNEHPPQRTTEDHALRAPAVYARRTCARTRARLCRCRLPGRMTRPRTVVFPSSFPFPSLFPAPSLDSPLTSSTRSPANGRDSRHRRNANKTQGSACSVFINCCSTGKRYRRSRAKCRACFRALELGPVGRCI